MSISNYDKFSFSKLCQIRFVNLNYNNDTDSIYMNYYILLKDVDASRYSQCVNLTMFNTKILRSFQNDCKSICKVYKDKNYKVKLDLTYGTESLVIIRTYKLTNCINTTLTIYSFNRMLVGLMDIGFYATQGSPINNRTINEYDEWLNYHYQTKYIPSNISYKVTVLER